MRSRPAALPLGRSACERHPGEAPHAGPSQDCPPRSGAWSGRRSSRRRRGSGQWSLRNPGIAAEAAPALESFAEASAAGFLSGIRAARAQIMARSDEDRTDFLRKRGFSKADTAKIIDPVLAEEGHPPASVFDFVQGITAFARTETRQDARLDVELKAKRLLDQVA